MITTADIETWLRANGLPSDALVTGDGFIPPTPDRIVCLTGAGGQVIKERAFDQFPLQVITRDGQRSDAAARAFAEAVDAILMGAQPPITIGGKRVLSINGGPPGFLDNEGGRRFSFVAVYTIQVARSVH